MKTEGTQRRFLTVAVATMLTLGVASGVYAQQPGDTTGGTTTGGTTTDNTSAGNANGGGLPQIQQQGDVAFVSGGVGLDESKALQAAQNHWPLSMRFTGPGSDFLANVQVRVVDAQGADVLSTTARGPYMLVRLHPGSYMVHAAYEGRDQTKAVTVSDKGTAKAAFYWNTQ